METLTIEKLIAQGKEILSGIKSVPSHPNVIRTYSAYQLADVSVYERWKNVVLRFLSAKYHKDFLFPDFKDALNEFEKKHYAPQKMKKILGILESYTVIPASIVAVNNTNKPSIVINNKNNQSQSQEQSMAINLFLEAIKDDLTGRQIKELKEIIAESGNDKEKARNGIIAKVKSFTSDVAANILANILTNPIILSRL